jgi:hypothetical protein
VIWISSYSYSIGHCLDWNSKWNFSSYILKWSIFDKLEPWQSHESMVFRKRHRFGPKRSLFRDISQTAVSIVFDRRQRTRDYSISHSGRWLHSVVLQCRFLHRPLCYFGERAHDHRSLCRVFHASPFMEIIHILNRHRYYVLTSISPKSRERKHLASAILWVQLLSV